MRAAVVSTLLAGLGLGVGIAVAQEPSPQVPSNPNPLAAVDPASLTGFRDRPLFSPTRTRPPDRVETEPEPEPADAPPETVNLQLLGVIGTPEGRSALVLDLDDDTRLSLREGEMLEGWTVSTLTATEMILSRDGETRRFPIFRPTETEATDDTPTDGAP